MLLGLLIPSWASGDVAVTFPLEDHYRPGRYIPVHVVGSGITSREVAITGDGALPTAISTNSGGIDATVPWLAISGRLQNVGWTDAGVHLLPVHLEPLGDTQRLVALAGVDVGDANAFFPGLDIVAVHLDAANPLPGPPCAWEALDGVLLDENAAARVNERQLRTLLAGGTIVAIRSQRRPGGAWPWKRAGEYWVVAHDRIGPEALIAPAAYGPTYGWERGLPFAVRRRALFAGLIVAALMVGASLLRSRGGLLGVGAVAVVASMLWLLWQSRQTPLSTLAARVVINSSSLTQQDQWTWLSSPVALDTTFSASGLVHPIFFTHSQLAQTRMRLVCTGDDQPIAFRFHLEPRLAIAFVSAAIEAEPDRHPPDPARSTFAAMAQDIYASPHLKIAGEYQAEDGSQTLVGRWEDSGD